MAADCDEGRTDEGVGDAAEHSGTTPARSWLRRTATALAGTALLAALVQLPTAPAGYADAQEAASGPGAASLNVDSLTPQVPTQHDTVKVTGTVTNHGDESITDAHVGVEVAPNGPFTSRSAISDTQANGNYSETSDGTEISGHTVRIPYIPPGISRSFTLDVPVSALGLGSDGVYQLGVSASGRTRSAPFDQVLGITRTFLPWYPRPDGQKTRTTFLWPLIDRPHLETRTSGDGSQTPLLRDDDLAAELAPGGRLQQMVALGKNLPVTWVIDPDLLATVDEMTKPYMVDGPGGDTTHTTPGTGTAYAKQWLNELQQAVQGGEVVALPFGDPDIASIAHHGAGVSGTIAHLKDATDLATTTVQTVLGVTPRTDFAWPADGQIDPSIVGVATSAGADNIIARSDSLRETGALSYTPTAARPIGGGTTAVVADAVLSKAFMGDMTTANASTLAAQTFLAQSLMITEQAPQQQRSIVIAPQRMPTTSQAQAMAAAISAQNGGGWSQPASLEEAAKATPDPAANRTVPGSGSYPSSLRRQEMSTAAFQQIQSVQDSLNSFLVILTRKDRVTIPFTTGVLRSMSTQWRGNDAGAAAFRDDVAAYLSDLTQAVRIINKESITLSGRGATIPVTVENDLVQPVTGLQLRLTSSQPNRLEVSGPQTIDIDGEHNRSLKFSTQANANGKAWVTAQLYTQDGTPYGHPMVFQVNVTSITATVMLVIGGGLLLLVLAGVRMYRQRKRVAERRAAEGAEEAEEPAEAEEHEGRVPKQSGDPLADTSPESADPPVAGEKVER
ncbi:DUF6049 family protein [Streptomyces sp. RB6PN25]|uniref:DUF6049 family protein n=1 Tax=Streptomyces humicola TaxID=2953240 RepID=A0ABT1PVV4_9ACTN|nr:DUF6049 family protein [Streptomyces humicola]MCQ4081798.1 DUF6049 family protein [Streptomyces humicola]